MLKDIIIKNNIELVLPFLFGYDFLIPIMKELLKEEFSAFKYVYGSPSCVWIVLNWIM